jgi:CheY-like chemotaxis protein
MTQDFDNVSILIIDDDQVDVRAVLRGLAQQKIANPVYFAGDGVEALNVLRGRNDHARIPRPFLILLDLNMPRMSGLEFLKELRADPELSDSIVFVLTTSTADEDKAAAYAQHVAGYLVKNEAGVGFLKAIQMLERYGLCVQFPG